MCEAVLPMPFIEEIEQKSGYITSKIASRVNNFTCPNLFHFAIVILGWGFVKEGVGSWHIRSFQIDRKNVFFEIKCVPHHNTFQKSKIIITQHISFHCQWLIYVENVLCISWVLKSERVDGLLQIWVFFDSAPICGGLNFTHPKTPGHKQPLQVAQTHFSPSTMFSFFNP